MEPALILLAVAGAAAAALRLLRWLLLALRSGTEALVAREAEQSRARRGDLTGMQDAGQRRDRARDERLRALLMTGFWLLLLIGPAFTPWARVVYAAYSPLWLMPGVRRARRAPEDRA